MTRWFTAAALLVAAAAVTASSAYASPLRDDGDTWARITDDSPYVLEPGETRLGLWKAQFAPPVHALHGLEIGTLVPPWLGFAFGVPIFNAHAEYQFLARGPFTASLGLGYFYASLDAVEVPVHLQGVPFSLLVGYRALDSLRLVGGVEGVYVKTSHGTSSTDKGEESYLHGAAAADNLSLLASVEWDVGAHISLVGQARFHLYQKVGGTAHTRVALGERTELEAFASASADLVGHLGYQAGGYAHGSWGIFNLKLGATYGNYSIPGAHLIVPKHLLLPELDIYVRF